LIPFFLAVTAQIKRRLYHFSGKAESPLKPRALEPEILCAPDLAAALVTIQIIVVKLKHACALPAPCTEKESLFFSASSLIVA